MHGIVRDLLVPGVPVAEKVVRALLVYVFLVVALRVGGKRQMAELSPLDLVVALTLSNAVQNAIIGDDSSVTGGFIGGGVLLLANHLAARGLYRSRKLDRLIEGEPTLLIEHGHPLRENMERELITEDHLLAACHEQGAERFEEVEKAILETGGRISVFVRHPTADEEVLAEVSRRLTAIEGLLADIRAGQGATGRPGRFADGAG